MISGIIIKNIMLCIIFFAILSISGWIIERQEKQECREFRHRFDKEKQQITDEVETAYNELFNDEL